MSNAFQPSSCSERVPHNITYVFSFLAKMGVLHVKLHLVNDDFGGRLMKDLTLSDSNPDFGFYGVEIFTRFEAGFE